MKKRIFMFYLLLIVIKTTIFSENILRIPKRNQVSVKTINTVEMNDQNVKIFNENDYPRIAKNKILINRINFFDKDENLLIYSDKMEINSIQHNNDSNVFLCLQYDDILRTEKKNSLYLFDFMKGQKVLIAVDVNAYLLSNDGKKVFYITNFNYKESSNINFSIFVDQKRKTQTINYKDYTDEICDSVIIQQENEDVVLYIYQDACVIVKLFINSNCDVINYALSDYDENTGYSFIINPDGSIEYLND